MMLAVVVFATLMDGIDGSIVNVALPTIGSDFGVDTAVASWVSVTYMMVLAGVLILCAKIATNIGIRRVMVAGLAFFTVGSLICGVSTCFEMLIVARVIQGLGAAMMGAAGPMCCVAYLPVSRLAFGLAMITVGSSVGFALGPALGGVLIQLLSWHWIFLINIPIGIIAIPLMLHAVPKDPKDRTKKHMDLLGAALLCASIVLGTYALESAKDAAGMQTALICTALCLISIVAFAVLELKKKHPLLNVRLFRHGDFVAIFLCLLLMNMSYMGMLYLIPFYTEICLGYSALISGLLLLIPAALTSFICMPIARWSDQKGRRAFCVAAGAFLCFGFGFFALTGRYESLLLMIPSLLGMGLGWAFTGGPMGSRLIEHVDRDEREIVASLTNEAYYIGGTVGTALFAILFTMYSHSDGIEISALTSSVFLDGFVPCAAFAAACCALIMILSAVVHDSGITSWQKKKA